MPTATSYIPHSLRLYCILFFFCLILSQGVHSAWPWESLCSTRTYVRTCTQHVAWVLVYLRSVMFSSELNCLQVNLSECVASLSGCLAEAEEDVLNKLLSHSLCWSPQDFLWPFENSSHKSRARRRRRLDSLVRVACRKDEQGKSAVLTLSSFSKTNLIVINLLDTFFHSFPRAYTWDVAFCSMFQVNLFVTLW